MSPSSGCAAALGAFAIAATLGCSSAPDDTPGPTDDATASGSTGPGSGGGGSTTGGSGGAGGGVAPPHPADCTNLDARFEALRKSFEDALGANAVPGGALALVCGTEVRSAGLGVVQIGGAPVTSSTRFQLASVTKMLTAAGALALVEKGTVDLAAPVAGVLPELGYGGEVTLHELLSHTSGLPTVFTHWSSYALLDLVKENGDMVPWSPPGAVWNYNNYGYAIAGGILEAASGKAYPDIVTDEVLGPIGMKDATMRVSDVIAGGDYAYGHSGTTVLAPTDSYYGDPSYGPMGGAWASADDMARFSQVLLGQGPLAARLAKQGQPYTKTGDPGQQYGYGLFLEEGVAPVVVHHSGSVEGFLSDIELVPDSGVAVVALVNADWYFPDEVALQGIESFVPIEPIGPDPGPPSAHWPLFEGAYDSSEFGKLQIRVDGSALYADFLDTGDTSQLTPEYGDSYSLGWKGETIDVTFWLDGDSPAQYIVSVWGVAERSP